MRKVLVALLIALISSVASADTKNEETVEKLNSLLRGEISAVETYRQALQKVGNEPGAEQIKKYHADHQAAVDYLKKEVTRLGGKPSTESGAWGAWAKTVQGTAKVFGDDSALAALKAGEQHGLDEYEEALESDDIDAAVKKEIKDKWARQQQEHIQGLDALMAKK